VKFGAHTSHSAATCALRASKSLFVTSLGFAGLCHTMSSVDMSLNCFHGEKVGECRRCRSRKSASHCSRHHSIPPQQSWLCLGGLQKTHQSLLVGDPALSQRLQAPPPHTQSKKTKQNKFVTWTANSRAAQATNDIAAKRAAESDSLATYFDALCSLLL